MATAEVTGVQRETGGPERGLSLRQGNLLRPIRAAAACRFPPDRPINVFTSLLQLTVKTHHDKSAGAKSEPVAPRLKAAPHCGATF